MRSESLLDPRKDQDGQKPLISELGQTPGLYKTPQGWPVYRPMGFECPPKPRRGGLGIDRQSCRSPLRGFGANSRAIDL